MESDDYSIREACWGNMHVEYGKFKKEMNVAPLLKGLPGDMCQSEHWGYVFKGGLKVNYADRAERIRAGDTYHIEPGHTGIIEAGTEYIEFSPEESYHRTMEVINRNIQAMSDGK